MRRFTTFGLTKTVTTQKIKKFPEAVKEQLRGLSFGSELGSMWRWTYHDGSTWATVLSTAGVGEEPLGWACLTLQEEPYPVLGVYVAKEYRGNGLAEEMLRTLIAHVQAGRQGHRLAPGSSVYAVAGNYPRYKRLLEELGLIHLEWV